MRTQLITGIGAIALALAACGGSGPDEASASAEAQDAAATPDAAVKAGQTPLGEVLISADGLTLYGFTNDTDARSTCSGTCAEAWPPVIVTEDWTAGPGLDTGIFSTTERDDGRLQLVAGTWPLYEFSGDAAPGDTAGQGSGDVWFAVGTDGRLIKDGASAPANGASTTPVGEAETNLGPALVDAAGLTLYGLTDDANGVPTCDGACADAWPPLTSDSAELPAGLDPNVFSVVERSDGTFQLKAGQWPLYRFAGDAAPGDTNGHGSGGVWFAVAPDGTLIDGDAAASDASEASSAGGY